MKRRVVSFGALGLLLGSFSTFSWGLAVFPPPVPRLAWDNPNPLKDRLHMVTEVQIKRAPQAPWETFAIVAPMTNTVSLPSRIYSGYVRARFAITNVTPWRYSAYTRTLAVGIPPLPDPQPFVK